MPTRRDFLKTLAAAPVAAAMTTELAKAAATPMDPRLVRPPTAPEGFIWIREVDLAQCGVPGMKIYESHPLSRHVLVDLDDATRHIYLRSRLASRGYPHMMDRFPTDTARLAAKIEARWIEEKEEE